MDDHIDRLYGLPLDEFTAARDALAKELRAGGDRGAAEQIKALRKPNLAAWALNQLVRRQAEAIDELVAATENVRVVQRKVMSGARADLRAATDGRNRVMSRLSKLAASILEESGHAAAQQTMSAITDSLVAVASDEMGDRLRAGRLSRELSSEPVMDVGPLGVVPPLEAEADAEAEAEAAPGPTVDTRALERTVEQARKRAEDAAESLERAEGEATRLAEAAEFARRALEARRAEAQESKNALAEAEQALREVRG
jgi:hypothetical protein